MGIFAYWLCKDGGGREEFRRGERGDCLPGTAWEEERACTDYAAIMKDR